MPSSASLPLKVVATETLSKTASTATPVKRFCSSSEMPKFFEGLQQFGINFVELSRAPSSVLGAE